MGPKTAEGWADAAWATVMSAVHWNDGFAGAHDSLREMFREAMAHEYERGRYEALRDHGLAIATSDPSGDDPNGGNQ